MSTSPNRIPGNSLNNSTVEGTPNDFADPAPEPTRAQEVNFGGWLRIQLERLGWSGNHFAKSGDFAGGMVYRWRNNVHRPHRALRLEPPVPPAGPTTIRAEQHRVHRRDRLGGLLHEYHRQAA